MRQSFSAVGLLAFIVGVQVGCTTPANTATSGVTRDAASPQPNGTMAIQRPGTATQYRAVCIEKEAHGGNEYVLTSWLDSKDKADELANYHSEFKYKGHRTRIDTRVKSARATPK